MITLSKWNLLLPVSKTGRLSGTAQVLAPARTRKPYFIASADRLAFECPAKGALAGGSESPRTELYQPPAAVWTRGKFQSAVTVSEVGEKICLLQIRAPRINDELLQLFFVKDGTLYAREESTGSSVRHYFKVKAKLGEQWKVLATVGATVGITITTAEGQENVTYPVTGEFKGEKLKWQFGAYGGLAKITFNGATV
jgi:hypothetical protein